jgi:hypothetical protein
MNSYFAIITYFSTPCYIFLCLKNVSFGNLAFFFSSSYDFDWLEFYMITISASLLLAYFASMREEVRRATLASVDSLYLDITDGYYVPNLTRFPYHIRDLKAYAHLPFIPHREVGDPLHILKAFADHPIDTVIFLADSFLKSRQIIKAFHASDAKAGMSINSVSSRKASSNPFQSRIISSSSPLGQDTAGSRMARTHRLGCVWPTHRSLPSV